ncbi:NADPH-dependent oxidoreductase [Veronia nyctiphanis]|uniref:NADPH-dependent oxidoreductase n=1 Tax=Veronia nyctiphanis TaxID=1278244 RepID=A0A4Q0YKB5_9GAMM|nr:NAD(P)H-dependent oxidoreductase [Veronia nyctiphanis]RXJ70404.1 NADPH-dependent oxidoreductase [Veronia nyctiphanis]
MNITIVAGTQRAGAQTLRVANYLQRVASNYFQSSEVIDLFTLDLPFWNEGIRTSTQEWEKWLPVAERLRHSDAFIFLTPEWHGMATPALKNFLMLTTDDELAHKPALLVSVSSSINGVYPISELRMTGSKNNHVCFLPDHLIFRNCEEILTKENTCSDEKLNARSHYTVELLATYSHALSPVHKDMVHAGKSFRYGM